jgi:hypothetical protein
MAQRNQKDWRELCTAVANETDSNKLGFLVQELIKALDEIQQNWRDVESRGGRVEQSAGLADQNRHMLRL